MLSCCDADAVGSEGNSMSTKNALVLASRTLAALLGVWAFTEMSYLPENVHSFLRYLSQEPGSSNAVQYWRHYHLIRLSFNVTRMVGFLLMARWLYKGGPEVEEMLLPSGRQESVVQN